MSVRVYTLKELLGIPYGMRTTDEFIENKHVAWFEDRARAAVLREVREACKRLPWESSNYGRKMHVKLVERNDILALFEKGARFGEPE